MFIFVRGGYQRAPKNQKKGETQIPRAFMNTLYIWLIAEIIQNVWFPVSNQLIGIQYSFIWQHGVWTTGILLSLSVTRTYLLGKKIGTIVDFLPNQIPFDQPWDTKGNLLEKWESGKLAVVAVF